MLRLGVEPVEQASIYVDVAILTDPDGPGAVPDLDLLANDVEARQRPRAERSGSGNDADGDMVEALLVEREDSTDLSPEHRDRDNPPPQRWLGDEEAKAAGGVIQDALTLLAGRDKASTSTSISGSTTVAMARV